MSPCTRVNSPKMSPTAINGFANGHTNGHATGRTDDIVIGSPKAALKGRPVEDLVTGEPPKQTRR